MTTENLELAFAAARAVLAKVRRDQLDDPTPCASWTVRDIVNHLVGNAFYFATAVNTGASSGPGDDDYTGGDWIATYDDGVTQAVAAFGSPGALDKSVALHFGSIPVAVFLGIATTDAFVHAWDVARATGQDTDLDPALAATLLEGARMFVQPAFRGDDTKAPFGPEQAAPANGSNADTLAAFMGRVV